VGLSLFGGGGWVNPDALNESVVREAQANLEKLERSGRDELHLVRLDRLNHVLRGDGYVPQERAAIGTITSALHHQPYGPQYGDQGSFRSNTSRLWRASPPGGWEMLAVPELPTTGPYPPEAEACQALERTDQGYPPLVCGGSSIQRPPSSDTASLRRKKYGEWCDEGRRAEKSRRCSRSP